MTAFIALAHREFLEHRGAFLVAPLVLVVLLFGATILAFTVGRIDAEFSGVLFTAAPIRVYEFGFLGFSFAWLLYLMATLFFYCADGFAADKRNNAMLFWKSLPVSDFTVLLSKLAATISIFPGLIYAVALLSGALLFGVAIVTSWLSGGDGFALLGNVVVVYFHVAASLLLVMATGLLWYLPFMALVGALATAVGRWAIPLSLLLPLVVSVIEWVTLGGGWHPFSTKAWTYLQYRGDFPLMDGYLVNWFDAGQAFDFPAFASDLIGRLDWVQIGLGVMFAVLVLFGASEYRRRRNDS